MTESNGNQEQSLAPDFNQALTQAKQTGDFDFVLQTAKNSQKMLSGFKEAIQNASISGKYAQDVAMGLNFLENMIQQSHGQINALKQMEKATKDALKSGKGLGTPEVASGASQI